MQEKDVAQPPFSISPTLTTPFSYVEKCVIETSRVESFLAPSLFSIVLVVSP
jgi:hypothetical protein